MGLSPWYIASLSKIGKCNWRERAGIQIFSGLEGLLPAAAGCWVTYAQRNFGNIYTTCAGDIRDTGSIPGWGRYPGGGDGNPLHYSCLKNPMNRGAWWATVHRITKSQTQLKCLSISRLFLCSMRRPVWLQNKRGGYFEIRPESCAGWKGADCIGIYRPFKSFGFYFNCINGFQG